MQNWENDMEANDTEREGLEALMNEANAVTTLNELADELEYKCGDDEEELIDALRATALTNPVSETAYDLVEQAKAVLI